MLKKKGVKLDRELNYINAEIDVVEQNRLTYYDNPKHISKSEMISLKQNKLNLELEIADLKDKIKNFWFSEAHDNYLSKLSALCKNDYVRAKNRLKTVKSRYNITKSDIINTNNNIIDKNKQDIESISKQIIELSDMKDELKIKYDSSTLHYNELLNNIEKLEIYYTKLKDIVRDISDIQKMI